jgi:hypothetical protein
MMRLIALAAVLGLCTPVLAADWRGSESEPALAQGYRCFWVETLHATYPSWVVSPDPYYYFIPQYYPLYHWACWRDTRRALTRRE